LRRHFWRWDKRFVSMAFGYFMVIKEPKLDIKHILKVKKIVTDVKAGMLI
jgi:hypothetical protein